MKIVPASRDADIRSEDARNVIGNAYHVWYYENEIWRQTEWQGIPTMKSPSDMWNYQEVVWDLKPTLIVEFGTFRGGSALYLAELLEKMPHKSKLLTVDPVVCRVHPKVRAHPLIEILHYNSVADIVRDRILELKRKFLGPALFILDSDHSAPNVFMELLMLQDLTVTGDYVIVEDSNINGHPVAPGVGPGPFEAIEEYDAQFPTHYTHDTAREHKFGWTFAPNGFLIRK